MGNLKKSAKNRASLMAIINRNRAKRSLEEATSSPEPGKEPMLDFGGQEAAALVALAEAAARASVDLPEPLTEQEAAKDRKRQRLHETLDRKACTANGSRRRKRMCSNSS